MNFACRCSTLRTTETGFLIFCSRTKRTSWTLLWWLHHLHVLDIYWQSIWSGNCCTNQFLQKQTIKFIYSTSCPDERKRRWRYFLVRNSVVWRVKSIMSYMQYTSAINIVSSQLFYNVYSARIKFITNNSMSNQEMTNNILYDMNMANSPLPVARWKDDACISSVNSKLGWHGSRWYMHWVRWYEACCERLQQAIYVSFSCKYRYAASDLLYRHQPLCGCSPVSWLASFLHQNFSWFVLLLLVFYFYSYRL